MASSIVARRISQGFFLLLFLWFCVVATVGTRFWQLRGWPVNWFLELDPLVAVGTALSTWTLPAGTWWALVTVTVTLLLGRVFCGWLCPMGTLQQVVGWVAHRRKKVTDRIALNRYRPAQGIKYAVLAVLLAGAAGGLLQTGLLDPIPMAQRSVSLAVLGALDAPVGALSVEPRHYRGAALAGALFLGFLAACAWIPRFFCRFLCPLGALLGVLARFAPWRIGKSRHPCNDCRLCDLACEGACSPGGTIRTGECLMCMNCLDGCSVNGIMTYGLAAPAAGVDDVPDISRRTLLASAFGGLVLVPLRKLTGAAGDGWDPSLIRPPGSLAEEDFLARCIKCGQCMRACPTNVLQPLLFRPAPSALWTPALDNRAGTSGCQLNCVACGNVCPTGAIQPLTLDRKLGKGRHREDGPVRIGTAFVDRGRCLPWAMDRPCIVCEENCPVAPKAIHLEEEFRAVHGLSLSVSGVRGQVLRVSGTPMPPEGFSTGDYWLAETGRPGGGWRIRGNGERDLTVERSRGGRPIPGPGTKVEVRVRLQKPRVDPDACIGCGVCEHECVVNGLRAIRITAENESRSEAHALAMSGKVS